MCAPLTISLPHDSYESILSFNLDLSLELSPLLTDILGLPPECPARSQNKYILRKHLPAFQTNSLFQDFWLVVLKLVHIQTQLSSFLHPTSVTAHCISVLSSSSYFFLLPLPFSCLELFIIFQLLFTAFVAAYIFSRRSQQYLSSHNLTGTRATHLQPIGDGEVTSKARCVRVKWLPAGSLGSCFLDIPFLECSLLEPSVRSPSHRGSL